MGLDHVITQNENKENNYKPTTQSLKFDKDKLCMYVSCIKTLTIPQRLAVDSQTSCPPKKGLSQGSSAGQGRRSHSR